MTRAGLALLLACGLAAAEGSPEASALAAAMVAEHARALRAAGETVFAGHLEELAALVRSGKVGLAEATQLVQLARAAAAAPAASTTSAATAPAPALPATAAPAAAMPVSALLDGPATAAAAAIPPPKKAPGPASAVLAIEPGSDGRPALVALRVLPGMAAGQRWQVQRAGRGLADLRIDRISGAVAMCAVVTLVDASLADGDQAVAIGE